MLIWCTGLKIFLSYSQKSDIQIWQFYMATTILLFLLRAEELEMGNSKQYFYISHVALQIWNCLPLLY